jgi:pimeloyl-ACP methyl ester carboxylesterase
MAHFILVHGAWHGGWCWERVAPALRAAGHRVSAPDLAGMGNDQTPFESDVLAQWARQIAAAAALDAPAILVGHSRGGIVISEAAELAPESVRRLVYLTAFLLPQGQSLQANVEQAGPGTGPEMIIDGERGVCTVRSGTERGVFYQLCSEVDSRAAIARLCPEPLEPLARGLRITAAGFGSVPRAYIEALDDQALRIAHQRAMRAALPCEPVVSIDSDHSPFYSAPEALVDALLQLA